MDSKYFDDMEKNIPKGIRTRFAPSPTGYMHVGNLRTALYAWLIARGAGGDFLLRIEDTDQARLTEGAVEAIYKTLRECGLKHDEGPDVGGRAAPYIQTERREIYAKYAELLIERGGAYRCFCQKPGGAEDLGFEKESDPCRELPSSELDEKLARGEAFVVRQKIPREGSAGFYDEIFGGISVLCDTLDDNVLIKSDGLPTYNFANVVDDHLMGISHVVRGTEYLSSCPKYNLLYEAFGWTPPKYVHCPPVMRDAQNKMSKRRGDPSYEDLAEMGYLPEAVVNYVALLGWSPGGEREKFSLSELKDVFDISGISKSPAIFDIEKLRYFNSEYIRDMTPKEFAQAAEPYIKSAVKNPAYDPAKIAATLQQRCESFADIPPKLDFFDELPEYSTELYVHQKSKTDKAVSLNMLREALPVLEALEPWERDTVHEAMCSLAKSLGVKNATVMWPVRIAMAGKAVTPGGAVEIAVILGRDEALRRIRLGIEALQNESGDRP